MSAQPRLTVALPVYNGQDYLGESLSSLLAQSFRDYILVISDNGSTDQTPEICYSYQRRDSRVHYVRHDVNRGPSWNFAHLLGTATTPYFMWAAADDLWHPDYIQSCIDQLELDGGLVIASSWVVSFGSGLQSTPYRCLSQIPAGSCWQTRLNFLNQPAELGKANIIYGIFRMSMLKSVTKHRLFNECWGGDMLLVYRCLTLGRLFIVEQPYFYKRQPSRLISQEHPDSHLPAVHERRAFASLLEAFRSYWPYCSTSILVDFLDNKITALQKFELISSATSLFCQQVWTALLPLLEMVVRHRRETFMRCLREPLPIRNLKRRP